MKCYELIPKLCLIFLNYKLPIIKENHKIGMVYDFRNICVKARQRFKQKTLFSYHFILEKLLIKYNYLDLAKLTKHVICYKRLCYYEQIYNEIIIEIKNESE